MRRLGGGNKSARRVRPVPGAVVVAELHRWTGHTVCPIAGTRPVVTRSVIATRIARFDIGVVIPGAECIRRGVRRVLPNFDDLPRETHALPAILLCLAGRSPRDVLTRTRGFPRGTFGTVRHSFDVVPGFVQARLPPLLPLLLGQKRHELEVDPATLNSGLVRARRVVPSPQNAEKEERLDLASSSPSPVARVTKRAAPRGCREDATEKGAEHIFGPRRVRVSSLVGDAVHSSLLLQPFVHVRPLAGDVGRFGFGAQRGVHALKRREGPPHRL